MDHFITQGANPKAGEESQDWRTSWYAAILVVFWGIG